MKRLRFKGIYNRKCLENLQHAFRKEFAEYDWVADSQTGREIMIESLIALAMEMAYWNGEDSLYVLKEAIYQFLVSDGEENVWCTGFHFNYFKSRNKIGSFAMHFPANG
jgi:hypothetical protein